MRMETRAKALRAAEPAPPLPDEDAGPGQPSGETGARDGADAFAEVPEEDAPSDGGADPGTDPEPDMAMEDGAGDAPADDAPAEDVMAEDISAEGIAIDDEPADAVPAGDDPAGDVPSAIVLPPRVTQPMAEAFLATARGAAALPVIDARGVEHLSTAYALVLVSLARAEAARGRRLAILAPSPAFVDAFADLGLFQDLMKMEFCQ